MVVGTLETCQLTQPEIEAGRTRRNKEYEIRNIHMQIL
jgi:hypothetical protein